MAGFVLDASVTLSWLLDDEINAKADQALHALAELGAIVPTLWHMEVRNAMLMAVRRNRITLDDTKIRLASLKDLPIVTDLEPQFDAAFDLGNQYTLTLYDAMYLELALRKQIPLVTLDGYLNKAATSDAGAGLPTL